MQRQLFFRSARIGSALMGVLATFFAADAHAQVAGTSGRPLPNVLLLVDSSGSMELMTNNNQPTCALGEDPNRWGQLLQALTGNIQPYFACSSVGRSTANFNSRYGINSKPPYDKNYYLDYHQPMSGGLAAAGDACVITPWRLPGAGSNGVGPGGLVSATSGTADKFPDDALIAYRNSDLGSGVSSTNPPSASMCTFDQTNDGQLDAAKDYARFALMTFDNDVDPGTGVNSGFNIDTTNPFKGTWSYLRNSGNPFFGQKSDTSGDLTGQGAQGEPTTIPACKAQFNEVGARNKYAPPWEGRLVPFPSPDATLYDLEAQNAQIQNVLLASRPYGATPIDGMLDDARDFYKWSPDGPGADVYPCRDKYIILLTDGSPNLDLRPSCKSTNDVNCPYPNTADVIAKNMYDDNSQAHVTTFVIGFSVNGNTSAIPNNGFPTYLLPTETNCKAWYDHETSASGTPLQAATQMNTICTGMNAGAGPVVGSTASACCELNRIAMAGSATGAYFAESQADVVLSFGKIMANILHSASTKTIPAFSPATQFSAAAFVNKDSKTPSAGEYIASYIPSAEAPWSGELDRTRFLCDGANTVSQPVTPQLASAGDFQSENLAVQTSSKKRLFITVLGDKGTNSNIDSGATIRPWAGLASVQTSTGADGIGAPVVTGSTPYKGKEIAMNDYSLGFAGTDWPLALNITNHTCKRGRAVLRATSSTKAGTSIVPALDDATNGAKDCSDVVWGFATASPVAQPKNGNPTLSPPHDFNIRCNGGTTAASGHCSISGDKVCAPATANSCPIGETCTPDCAALGAIYHSSPQVMPPPQNLNREEGFRAYQQNFAGRQSVVYAATTDGLMHAFKAFGTSPSDMNELWAFVPPAVLPLLQANYPSGNQVLLDGRPVVREVVLDRVASSTTSAAQWHSVLVAGLGTTGGYYALNVTDADCHKDVATGECQTLYSPPSATYDFPHMSTGGDKVGDVGPHFLWQLTDIPAADPLTSEPAKPVRTSTLGTGTTATQVGLFGRNTSTPAIGTVQIKGALDNAEHQVGIAILPGGYNDPPVPGDVVGCPRGTKPSGSVLADGPVRLNVRKWTKDSCTTGPVPGRNVTIVRLDTGEVIRVFGRIMDTPSRLAAKLTGNGGLTETIFDSPMVGTPVVYPDQVGVPIQKVFIGDADGTVWRIDLSSTDPKDWHANLWEDLLGTVTATNPASVSQPIQVPPVLATDDAGNVILNVATGDQESMVASKDTNFVYSIQEVKDSSGVPHAKAIWYKTFADSERVTGPMTIFDRTLYFASYQPTRPSGGASCDGLGIANLWGMQFNVAATATGAGGVPKWCPNGAIDTITGVCNAVSGFVDHVQNGTDIIPGVVLTNSQACTTDGATDEYGNSAFSTVSQTQYSLSFGIAKPQGAGQASQAARSSVQRPLPRISTKIDSWSIVVE